MALGRPSSNPVFSVLEDNAGTRQPARSGGQATMASQAALQQQQAFAAQQEDFLRQAAAFQEQQNATAERPITIDDVVTKTALTVGVIVAVAAVSFGLSIRIPALIMPFFLVGTFGGLITVLIASFKRKMDSAAITLTYAALEGLALGVFSLLVASMSSDGSGGAFGLIASAVAGTMGVFVAMVLIYRANVIRVTPKFTRIILSLILGVIAVNIANLLVGLFTRTTDPFGIYSGGPMAMLFSIVCIVLAALSFLNDFDAADKLIAAGAPSRYAWGVALGLAVTLVWLYTEILRLLSYFSRD